MLVRMMIIASVLSNGTGAMSLVGQVELLILLLIATLIVALLVRLMRVPYTLLLVIVGFIVGIVDCFRFFHMNISILI